MATKKPATCPECRAKGAIRRIVYGVPVPLKSEAEARRHQATIVYGGCMMFGGGRDNIWRCVECEYEWGAKIP